MVPLSHMLLSLPPPSRPLRPSWSLLRASQLWWVTCPLSLPALCQQAQRRACFRCTPVALYHCTTAVTTSRARSVESVTEQQLLMVASSWGGVTIGMAFTLMQGGAGGAHVYQAQVSLLCCFTKAAFFFTSPPATCRPLQVSTSSSRVVKILGDAVCVRTLLRDTCGCDVTLSPSPPAAAAAGTAWGCSDAAAIAGEFYGPSPPSLCLLFHSVCRRMACA